MPHPVGSNSRTICVPNSKTPLFVSNAPCVVFSCDIRRVIYGLSSFSWMLTYTFFPIPGCLASPRNCFLISRFRILPVGLLGSSLTETYSLGTLKGDKRDFRKDFSSSGTTEWPGPGTMKAATRSPHSLSGSPMTAHSSTSGRVYSCSSTSRG